MGAIRIIPENCKLTLFVLEDVEMLLVNHHAAEAGLVGVAEKWKEKRSHKLWPEREMKKAKDVAGS